MARMNEKPLVQSCCGSIVRMEDKMFGGMLYVVFNPDGNCVKKTLFFDEAMAELNELRLELKAS